MREANTEKGSGLWRLALHAGIAPQACQFGQCRAALARGQAPIDLQEALLIFRKISLWPIPCEPQKWARRHLIGSCKLSNGVVGRKDCSSGVIVPA